MQSLSANSVPRTAPSGPHWLSVWQFGLSLLSIFMLWALSALVAFLGLSSAWLGASDDALVMLLTAAGSAFVGVLLIPSLAYAFFRLLNKPIPIHLRIGRPVWVIFVLPPVLLGGHFVVGVVPAAYLILPVVHVLAAGIAVLWLLVFLL